VDNSTIKFRRSEKLDFYLYVFIASFLGILGGHKLAYRWEDAYWYYQLAEGKVTEVIQPFAGRQLTKHIAHAISTLFHITLNHAFEIFGIGCLVLFAIATGWILLHFHISRSAMLSLALIAFWPLSFSNYILPDLLNSLLIAIFLILLIRQRYTFAALCLLPLGISRESVLLIFVCFLIAGWKHLRWPVVIVAGASTFYGSHVAKMLAQGSPGNRYHLGSLAYTALKMPWNFALNVLGIVPWSNTLPTYCTQPKWYFTLLRPIGSIRSVGYCGFDHQAQMTVLANLTGMFGLWLIMLLLLIRHRRTALWPNSVFLRFCLLYGGLSFLLAPIIGAAFDRLIAYDWPLFLLAVPILAVETGIDTCLPPFYFVITTAIFAWGVFKIPGNWITLYLLFMLLTYCYSWFKAEATLRMQKSAKETEALAQPV